MDGRQAKIAEALAQVVQEEEPGEWTDVDIDRFKKDNLTVLSKQLEGRIQGAHIGARAASLSSRLISFSLAWKSIQQQPGSPSQQQHQLHQRVQLLREPTALALRLPKMSQILSTTVERSQPTERPKTTDTPTGDKPQPPPELPSDYRSTSTPSDYRSTTYSVPYKLPVQSTCSPLCSRGTSTK